MNTLLGCNMEQLQYCNIDFLVKVLKIQAFQPLGRRTIPSHPIPASSTLLLPLQAVLQIPQGLLLPLYGAAAGCLQAGDFFQFLPVNFVCFLQEKRRWLVGRALLGYSWHLVLTSKGNQENPGFMGYNRHPFNKQGGEDAKAVQIQ